MQELELRAAATVATIQPARRLLVADAVLSVFLFLYAVLRGSRTLSGAYAEFSA
jgi:hypothetical protein